MWNLIATALILAVTIVSYMIAMWVTKVTNDRGDEIVNGVVKGVPASTKDRWMLLITQWMPYAIFLIGFLVITAVGNIRLAKSVDDPQIELFGYMCAGFLVMGALFWLLLGMVFLLPHMISAIRATSRE